MKLNIASGISNKKIQIFAATGGKELSSKLPLIIFLHGAGMDHTVWNLQTRYFAYHGYSVLSIDFPGHGRSEGPLMENIEQMARSQIWVVLRHLRVTKSNWRESSKNMEKLRRLGK